MWSQNTQISNTWSLNVAKKKKKTNIGFAISDHVVTKAV